MKQHQNRSDGDGDIVEGIFLAGVTGAILITSVIALLVGIFTAAALTRVRRIWYLAALTPAIPLVLLARHARNTNPDQWVGDTLKAPFRTRTVWNTDPTPSIGETWANTPYLHGWLTASICAGILGALAVRLIIDTGLWNPDLTFLQRGTSRSGGGGKSTKPTTPGC
ncbi:MAG: hypothetical protein R2733_17095 [Acidimicrobiales bacterium]